MAKQEETLLQERPEFVQSTVRVLVVEDEALFAKAVSKRLRKAQYDCAIAGTLHEATRLLEEQTPDLILLDMRLPDGSGLDFLEPLRKSDSADIPVVVLTAFGELEDAVDAMKLNAADYLKKPIDLEELMLVLKRVLNRAALKQHLDYSRERESRTLEEEQMVGTSPQMGQVHEQIGRLSQLTSMGKEAPPTVLFLGETGSGKDLAARMLHLKSARRNRPFVQVDCAALPSDLIEAELFGHEKGAFTGAHAARTGLIEAAEDGTLFLDEVAELPLELQPKLLAVLERRTVRRVGSSRQRPVPAWLIAGTNRPLDQMVDEGRFRSDLYFRLKVLTLTMPPLRDRGNDVIELSQFFAEQTARRFGLPVPELEADAADALRHYHWPGNVRELAHLVERAILLTSGHNLNASALMLDAKPSDHGAIPSSSLDRLTLQEAEVILIQRALKRTEGNVSEAARQLGVTRMALRYRMKQYGMSAHE